MRENKVGKPRYPLFLHFDIQLFILKLLMKARTVSDVNRAVLGLTLFMEMYTVLYCVISS